MLGTMAGMPKKPAPSTDELARILWQAEAKADDILIQQMLDRLAHRARPGASNAASRARRPEPGAASANGSSNAVKTTAEQQQAAIRLRLSRDNRRVLIEVWDADSQPLQTQGHPRRGDTGNLFAWDAGSVRALQGGDKMAGSRTPRRWHGRGRRGGWPDQVWRPDDQRPSGGQGPAR